MAKVIFKTWSVGMRKVELSKLFSQEANISLSDAKSIVDSILDEKAQVIQMETLEEANSLAEKASALGAICDVVTE